MMDFLWYMLGALTFVVISYFVNMRELKKWERKLQEVEKKCRPVEFGKMDMGVVAGYPIKPATYNDKIQEGLQNEKVKKIYSDLADWYDAKERKEILAYLVKFRQSALEKLHDAIHEAIKEASPSTISTTFGNMRDMVCPACGSKMKTFKSDDDEYRQRRNYRATCCCGIVYLNSEPGWGLKKTLHEEVYNMPITFREVTNAPR